MTTSEFIARYRTSDPRDLALQARRYPDVDMPYALNQIQGWQTARLKLPSWAACDGVSYPPHINMEQCSSEATARYKQRVAACWVSALCRPGAPTCMTDLTGGFGVDFSFVSRSFDEATYVERNPSLCDVARSNMACLGLSGVGVVCADAADYISSMPRQTMLFADPARRDGNGGKTVFIADCTPDVCAMLPLVMSKSDFAMLKLSPMLDWHKAVDDLHGAVREVHIVSVGGECKELLLVLSSSAPDGIGGVRVVCADIQSRPDAGGNYGVATFVYTAGAAVSHTAVVPSAAPVSPSDVAGQYLYEPNASVMKAGCFGEIERAYGVRALSPNSHLFLSPVRLDGFPGREFSVTAVTTMNKRQLRDTLAPLKQANIAVRNFPLSVADLRKRLKLRDGGPVYIFATTCSDGTRVLLVARKVGADV